MVTFSRYKNFEINLVSNKFCSDWIDRRGDWILDVIWNCDIFSILVTKKIGICKEEKEWKRGKIL